jgi:hypothetical protein
VDKLKGKSTHGKWLTKGEREVVISLLRAGYSHPYVADIAAVSASAVEDISRRKKQIIDTCDHCGKIDVRAVVVTAPDDTFAKCADCASRQWARVSAERERALDEVPTRWMN